MRRNTLTLLYPTGLPLQRWAPSCPPRLQTLSLHPEQIFGLENDRLGPALPGLLHQVCRPAGAIPRLAVPQRDQGHVVAARGQGVVEHPQIVALPDAVIRLLLQPARQFLRLGQHPLGEPFAQPPEAFDPLRAGRPDRSLDELIRRQGQVELGRDAQLGAHLVEEDVAATRAACDPEGNFAGFRYFLRDRILNGLPRDALFIRREARALPARIIKPVAREQEDPRVLLLPALGGAGFGG